MMWEVADTWNYGGPNTISGTGRESKALGDSSAGEENCGRAILGNETESGVLGSVQVDV